MTNSLRTQERPGCLQSYIIIGAKWVTLVWWGGMSLYFCIEELGEEEEESGEGGWFTSWKGCCRAQAGREEKVLEKNSMIAWSHAGSSSSSVSGLMHGCFEWISHEKAMNVPSSPHFFNVFLIFFFFLSLFRCRLYVCICMNWVCACVCESN